MAVVEFPEPTKAPELLVGPFEVWKVVVDGRMIPRLTGYREGDATTWLIVDGRFGCGVPNAIAHSVAYVIANALAIGGGYSHLSADTKDMPFAPKSMSLDADPRGGKD